MEYYIKDAFTNTFTLTQDEKENEYKEAFSYLGSQHNPPDFIIRNGDAFEVKKTHVERNKRGYTQVQLNSSPPKRKLHSNDRRITIECRNCEDEPWDEKEHYYVFGQVLKQTNTIRELFIIHGTCYCAEREAYNPLHDNLKDHINNIIVQNNYNSKETVELGKIHEIDPLSITQLRMRGMWLIKSPFRLYESLGSLENNNNFTLTVLLTEDQYNSYPEADRRLIEEMESLNFQRIQIKNPNDGETALDAILIKFLRE